MSEFLPFVIAGLAAGSLYGLAATGLVLTFKTSGIFNFAHGAIGAAAAYIFWDLHYEHGWPWPITGILVIGLLAPLGGIVLERLARGLQNAATAPKVVATVGLLLAIQGTLVTCYGREQIFFPQFLPTGTVVVLNTFVGYDQIIVMIVSLVATGGLYAFFARSRTGLAMRGVVDDADLLDLGGTSPTRVRRQAWMIGSAFAALSGVLLAPNLGLDALLLTLLVVQAFGAAAVGRFDSLPLTYLGGLVIGIGGALATKYVVDFPSLVGVPSSIPFMLLFLVLLLTKRGTFTESVPKKRVVHEHLEVPRQLRWAGGGVVAVAFLLVPHVVGARLPVYTNAVVLVGLFAAFQLLVRTSGQVSLCQVSFAAVGAVAFSHLAQDMGVPWLLALIGAGLVTVPVGAFVAIPAIRLSGLFLALATLGFGILLERLFYNTDLMFKGTDGIRAPRPGELLGVDLGADKPFYYLCLALAVGVSVVVVAIVRSRLGRLLNALADSPTALATHGASVNVARLLVFCISAFFTGMAGALSLSLAGANTGATYQSLQSLSWLAVLFIAGRTVIAAPVIAATLIAVVPVYIESPTYIDLQPVIFGGLAIVASLGMAGSLPWKRWAAAASPRDRSPVKDRWEEHKPLRGGLVGGAPLDEAVSV